MAVITAPVKGFTGFVAGVDFKDGVGETDIEGAIHYFERQGYGVGSPIAGPKPLEDQSKSELEATASAAGIEFKAPINKTELVALIEAAATPPAE